MANILQVRSRVVPAVMLQRVRLCLPVWVFLRVLWGKISPA